MVKQTKHNTANEFSKHNENELLTVNEGFSQLLSKRKSKDNHAGDDLIVSLADAYENKRARQVVEWDKVVKQNLFQNIQRAA